MEFEELQTQWQEQESGAQVKVDREALSKLIQRNQRSFEGTIFRRDCIEIAVALGLIPFWIWSGVVGNLPWTWYLVIPGALWVAGFLYFDRRVRKRKAPRPGSSLREYAMHAKVEVLHQVKLLKGVFWWYLFPISLPICLFFFQVAWMSGDWWGFAHNCLFVGLIYWGVYELNQRAVRKDLIPRAEELQGFLDSLESPGGESNETNLPEPS